MLFSIVVVQVVHCPCDPETTEPHQHLCGYIGGHQQVFRQVQDPFSPYSLAGWVGGVRIGANVFGNRTILLYWIYKNRSEMLRLNSITELWKLTPQKPQRQEIALVLTLYSHKCLCHVFSFNLYPGLEQPPAHPHLSSPPVPPLPQWWAAALAGSAPPWLTSPLPPGPTSNYNWRLRSAAQASTTATTWLCLWPTLMQTPQRWYYRSTRHLASSHSRLDHVGHISFVHLPTSWHNRNSLIPLNWQSVILTGLWIQIQKKKCVLLFLFGQRTFNVQVSYKEYGRIPVLNNTFWVDWVQPYNSWTCVRNASCAWLGWCKLCPDQLHEMEIFVCVLCKIEHVFHSLTQSWFLELTRTGLAEVSTLIL